MLRIAIVDDDYRVIAGLTDILSGYYGAGKYIQDDYANGLEFVQSLKENCPDIVFMDIEMGLMDGKDAVKRLRELDAYENTYVIYVSSHTDNLTSLFALHPFDFIVKPFTQEDVFRVLDKISEHIVDDAKTLQLMVNRKEMKIPVNDIMWVQSLAHRLEIKLVGLQDPMYSYCKLNDLAEQLEALSQDFMRIHTSYIINRRYVTKYTQSMMYIEDVEFPISRKYRTEITMKIHERL